MNSVYEFADKAFNPLSADDQLIFNALLSGANTINGFRNQEDMRFDRLAVSYGTGFQIASPAGPIRIDRAWVLEHHDFEYSDRWHFTILYAF